MHVCVHDTVSLVACSILRWCSLLQDSSEELLRAIQRDDVPSVRKLLQRARSANENALNIDQVSFHFWFNLYAVMV